jgi:hypothetical protein
MLAARCRDSGATAVADRDAGPAIIAMASGDTIAITDAITATIAIANAIADAVPTTITVSTADSTTAAGSRTATSARTAPTSAATVRQCRAGGQGSNQRSEHEHSESGHVAPPPETISITQSWVSTC